jgi:hypothetical protein
VEYVACPSPLEAALGTTDTGYGTIGLARDPLRYPTSRAIGSIANLLSRATIERLFTSFVGRYLSVLPLLTRHRCQALQEYLRECLSSNGRGRDIDSPSALPRKTCQAACAYLVLALGRSMEAAVDGSGDRSAECPLEHEEHGIVYLTIAVHTVAECSGEMSKHAILAQILVACMALRLSQTYMAWNQLSQALACWRTLCERLVCRWCLRYRFR